jgi:hypothetical protein
MNGYKDGNGDVDFIKRGSWDRHDHNGYTSFRGMIAGLNELLLRETGKAFQIVGDTLRFGEGNTVSRRRTSGCGLQASDSQSPSEALPSEVRNPKPARGKKSAGGKRGAS